MSNELRDTIAQALADQFDLGLDEQVVESSRVDVTLQSAADAVLAALQTRGWLFTPNDARLLRLAIDWMASAIRDDPNGEPWLMTRTVLNQLIERFDQYTAMVGSETPWAERGVS